jgi:carbohydrate kinase (thermoresistant glucokinase family)
MSEARTIVVMGVSGSGKSTIGSALATRLGFTFIEADAFHSAVNIEKMAGGTPLTDSDRWPWLEVVEHAIESAEENHTGSVTACSALRRSYRDHIRAIRPLAFFVFLEGSYADIEERVKSRASGLLPISLLESQFSDLEVLDDSELGLTVDSGLSPEAIVELVVHSL